GEEAVQSLLKKYYIVRAGWMIGGHNKDKKFVWKIVQLLNTKKEISVVTDKTGSPTFTSDFSRGIVDIVGSGKYGLYHCVNKGICTRYDIAVKIAEYLRKKDVVIKPVTSDVFPLPAPRGKSEAMVNSKLAKMGLDNSRPWQDALKEYLKALK
ncbi:MAG: sugar nucleotide-binding protein, partial [Candidatus Omnitrophota bacterium]